MRLVEEIFHESLLIVGAMSLILIAACSDVSGRNNIHDANGEHYCDVAYYLNHNNEKGSEGDVRYYPDCGGKLYIYKDAWQESKECAAFGQIIRGSAYVENTFFCNGREWKRFYGNEKIAYGKLVDERDGQVYRTIKVGSQTWMAENLNYVDDVNFPSKEIFVNALNGDVGNSFDGGDVFGRYYYWSDAFESSICPNGWHIPEQGEWGNLYDAIGKDYKLMQAKSLWDNATDAYGFSVLPGCYYDGERSDEACFWVTHRVALFFDADGIHFSTMNANMAGRYWFSVRCVKDEEE